jgi:hypothetical protein
VIYALVVRDGARYRLLAVAPRTFRTIASGVSRTRPKAAPLGLANPLG